MSIVIPDRLLPVSKEQLYRNTRIKINPRTGEVMEVCIASRPIYKTDKTVEARTGPEKRCKGDLPGRETWETEEASAAMGDRWEAQEQDGKRRAASRAKRKLFDTAFCNDFDLFFTLTLSPDEIDRYDYKATMKKLTYWLNDRVKRRGLRYVMVPELHKDGALHFHGLANSEALRLVDSGHKDKRGKVIYNLPEWRLGFTTAVKLDGDYGAVCRYVSKYITKQAQGGTIGGRYWYHGGNLRGPVYRYEQREVPEDAKAYEIPEAGLTLYYPDITEGGESNDDKRGYDGGGDQRCAGISP